MITVTVGHTKSGVLLMFDEPDAWTKVIRLSWLEAIGLQHAINEACANPLFKRRDPKSQKSEVRFADNDSTEDSSYLHIPVGLDALDDPRPSV